MPRLPIAAAGAHIYLHRTRFFLLFFFFTLCHSKRFIRKRDFQTAGNYTTRMRLWDTLASMQKTMRVTSVKWKHKKRAAHWLQISYMRIDVNVDGLTWTIEMVLCRQFNSITNGERCADGGDEHWIIKPTHRISIDNSHRARRSTHPQENFVDSYFTFKSRGGIFFAKHNPSYFRRNPKLCSVPVENRTQHSQFSEEKKQHKIWISSFFSEHSHFPPQWDRDEIWCILLAREKKTQWYRSWFQLCETRAPCSTHTVRKWIFNWLELTIWQSKEWKCARKANSCRPPRRHDTVYWFVSTQAHTHHRPRWLRIFI